MLDRRKVVLLRKDRAAWELPGGRPEAGESPRECVEREIFEESNLTVGVGPLLDAWVFGVLPGSRVLVLAYGCFARGFARMAYSAGHVGAAFFGLDELESVALPPGYARAVRAWAGHPVVLGPSGV